MMGAQEHSVVLVRTIPKYPSELPFHPHLTYPEYPFRQEAGALSTSPNTTYDAIRNIFLLLGLDAENVGKDHWNPLGSLVRPGQTIVVKPNWVAHKVQGDAQAPEDILACLVTHTAVLRAIIDFAYLAVGKQGKIIIADAPIQGTDFDLVLNRSNFSELVDFYRSRGVPLEVLDLRRYEVKYKEDGRIIGKNALSGDPKGYIVAKVDNQSALCGLDEYAHLYRLLGHDDGSMSVTHRQGHHHYLLSRTVLEADLLINVPKLKTHVKTGFTAAMKNLVGINGDKRYLPHYRLGAPSENGDDYPVPNPWLRLKSQYRVRAAHWPRVIREPVRHAGNLLINRTLPRAQSAHVAGGDPYLLSAGSWYGNDTAWRMVADLNRALMYCNPKGELQESIQRTWLSIVDGIVGGEGNGPLQPTPRDLGCVIAGYNSVCVDAVCAQLMGFDWRKLPLLAQGYPMLFGKTDLETLRVVSDDQSITCPDELEPVFFRAPDGWRNQIELGQDRINRSL